MNLRDQYFHRPQPLLMLDGTVNPDWDTIYLKPLGFLVQTKGYLVTRERRTIETELRLQNDVIDEWCGLKEPDNKTYEPQYPLLDMVRNPITGEIGPLVPRLKVNRFPPYE